MIKKAFYLSFIIIFLTCYKCLLSRPFVRVKTKNDTRLNITTPYGKFIVEEPVLIEIIRSKPFQRLKGVHQYGHAHYIKSNLLYAGKIVNDYTRYDHSICLFSLYRYYKRPVEEQISALLHDISHSAFSHVADLLKKSFKRGNNTSQQTAYQDEILEHFLEKHGITTILDNHSINIKTILQKPDLDRIDYTLVGGLLAGLLTKKEVTMISKNLSFHPQRKVWYFENIKHAREVANVSLQLSTKNSGSPWCIIINNHMANALKKAFEIGLFSKQDFLYNLSDDQIWEKLTTVPHEILQAYLDDIINHERKISFSVQPEKTHQKVLVYTQKIRSLNPYVIYEKKSIIPLIKIDFDFRKKFFDQKAKLETGILAFLNFTNTFKKNEIKGC